MNKILVFFCLLLITVSLRAQIQNDSSAIINTDTINVNENQPPDSLGKNEINKTSGVIHEPSLNSKDFRMFKVNDNKNCHYNLKLAIDLPVTGLAMIGSGIGAYLVNTKDPADSATIANLNVERDITWALNKDVTHNFDPKMGDISDFFLYGGFFYGFLLLADHDIRQDALKIGLLYLQTMSITGASYELNAGNVDKFRPYAYNTDSVIVDGVKAPEVPFQSKTSHNSKNSFYGGHPSVPAASTLFVASVYAAYHPHSAFRFVLYGVAVAATGTTAYLRYKGGYHFPSDLAIGVALGSTYGLLVPHLHRCKKDGSGLSIAPLTGQVKGFDLRYTF